MGIFKKSKARGLFVKGEPKCLQTDVLKRSSLSRSLSHLYVLSAPSLRVEEDMPKSDLYVKRFKELGPGRSFGPILGNFIRYINMCLVSSIFWVLLRVFNRVTVHGRDRLDKLVLSSREDRPLLSVSNHQSFLDDPGLWAAILPWWRMTPENVRWGLCTEDVFFAVPWLQPMMGAGNVIPLDRSGSLFQPSFQYFAETLYRGSWCHLFPEGRIWQRWRFDVDEEHLGPFKIGVGRLLAHSRAGRDPIILPMYHTGMDEVVPEKRLKRGSKRASRVLSKVPGVGKSIHVYFGEPFSVRTIVQSFREENPGVLDDLDNHSKEVMQLYSDIAEAVRERVGELERKACSH